MSDPEWYVGRSTEGIKEEKSQNLSPAEEIAKEERKSAQAVRINLTQMKQTPSTQNIISFVQLKTNDLPKIKRLLLYCFKYLAKTQPDKVSSSSRKISTLWGEEAVRIQRILKSQGIPIDDGQSQSPILLGVVLKTLVFC